MEAEIHVQVKNNSPSIEVKMEAEIHAEVKDSPSIERILRPISYISWLMGVGVAHPRKCPKAITIIIRIIYMTVCSIGMIYEAKSLLSFIDHFKMVHYLICLNEVMAYVLAYYYICHGIRQYNKWPELMDRLKELDQKIKKEISMNDKSIKIVAALAVFATISCLIIPIVFYYIHYHFFTPAEFMFFIVLPNVILAQSLINSFVFDVVVYVLYCRFQTINKLIGQLDKLSDVLAFKIRHIRELHADICEMASIINNIYSLPLLFCLMNCFITSVTVLFELYHDFNEKITDYVYVILQNFCCIVCVTQFYLICWICTLVRQEFDRTGRIIYEIILKCKPINFDKHEATNLSSLEVQPPLKDQDGEQSFNRSSSHNLSYVDIESLLRRNLDQDCVTKEINDFSIQLQQHRVTFTAYDFFEINNSLFRGFVGMIITYLIIFIQFYQRPENLDKNVVERLSKIF
ncbi:uncharacterized protein LOC105195378 isoform X2 [Solenopsis invicta]|uniref:uncharacterized protein LOC105195378 isoform X2 n=1 Tax=Solenopsis invicta TaxID=13686 RepID=UPI00193DE0BD|nr:uncharacterized protein LOC105195378 isoform X2 [Solenopsis invicta]